MINTIRQIKQGNSKAFKAIFDRYWNIVYRFTGLYLMDNVLSVRSAIQLSHRLDDLQKVRQEIRSHLEEKAAQLQQKYEGRLEEVTDRFMAGLEDANDDFLKEKKLYLAQLRSGEDLFERRLLRSHPDLRSKRHSRKLLNLLREKRPGQKDKK